MSLESNIAWVEDQFKNIAVYGKSILDVGSRNWKAENPVEVTIRKYLETRDPAVLVGVDIQPGPEVDIVCGAEYLDAHFGPIKFDIVLCLEVLEHVEDWRRVVNNLKLLVAPGGHLVITTRTPGYPPHGYPDDFWRYEKEHFQQIFADLNIWKLDVDKEAKGIYLVAQKPYIWKPRDLSDISLPGAHG